GRRWLNAALQALPALLAVIAVRAWIGGYVAPCLTALTLVFIRLNPRGTPGPLPAAVLGGLYTGLFWPLGLAWSAVTVLLRTWAGPHRRRLRWIPPVQAVTAVGGGLAWNLPDAFLILAVVVGGLQVTRVLPHFLPSRRRGRAGRLNPSRIGRIAIMGATMVGVGLYLLNLYVYQGFGETRELVRRADVQMRAVALTFDDGPNPRYTTEVLDILRAEGVTATFFLVGREVEAYPELARRIVAEGHEVGSHTYSHKNLLGAKPETVRREIMRGNLAIETVTGVTPRFFRPPRGAYNQAALATTAETSQQIILFSLSSRDWLELAPSEIARNILRRVRPGDILLLHDSGDLVRSRHGDRSNTLRALPRIIAGLRDQGYVFLTVSQLLVIASLEEDGPP
ncbi:MAG TPA: polysaccharide deacetylase family protein, partial [Bacillota bacterium]